MHKNAKLSVLFIGHDIAYAKFYSAIEKRLKELSDTTSCHIYSRPSAFFFAKFILALNAISPFLKQLATEKNADSKSPEAEIDFRFYERSPHYDKNRLISLFLEYRDFFSRYEMLERANIIIMPGEFRIFEQAILSLLKDHIKASKIIYFEAGPPKYIYLDNSGVNANASFTGTGKNPLLVGIDRSINSPSPDEKPHPLVELACLSFDVLWIYLVKLITGLGDLEEYLIAFHNKIKKIGLTLSEKFKNKGETKSAVPPLTGRLIIFLGQVKNDVNNTHFGLSDSQLREHLVSLLNSISDVILIWRDHPLEPSTSIFEDIRESFPGRVFRSQAKSLHDDLRRAVGVVTVNSNGGLEALQQGVPVFLLGKAYYQMLEGVCVDIESFKSMISLALPESRERIANYAQRFISDCFLPIDYRGQNFSNSELAARVILHAMEKGI